LLKAAKRPTLRADQVFKKFHPPAHRKNFCGIRVLFKARVLELTRAWVESSRSRPLD
jgi:hypothetical protein